MRQTHPDHWLNWARNHCPIWFDIEVYLKLNWSLIPLCHPEHRGVSPLNHIGGCKRPGKEPIHRWKERQSKPHTTDEIAHIYTTNPHLNLGVVTGLVSGIVMVDIDTPQGGQAWLDAVGISTPETWEYGTGRGGSHLVYRWPYPFRPDGNPFPDLKGHLDFLGEGRQSVLPPSIHRSGERYRWLNGGPCSNVEMAEAPSVLCVSSERYATPQREPVGGGFGAQDTRGGLPEQRQMRRAIAWAQKAPPAVQGNNGNGTLFCLACALVHGFGIGDDAAIDIMLTHWNHRCRPVWSGKEIARAVLDARNNGNFPKLEEK